MALVMLCTARQPYLVHVLLALGKLIKHFVCVSKRGVDRCPHVAVFMPLHSRLRREEEVVMRALDRASADISVLNTHYRTFSPAMGAYVHVLRQVLRDKLGAIRAAVPIVDSKHGPGTAQRHPASESGHGSNGLINKTANQRLIA
jgi:hypothetical protein